MLFVFVMAKQYVEQVLALKKLDVNNILILLAQQHLHTNKL